MSDRFFMMLERHKEIDNRLREEQNRMRPDQAQISILKKRKLAIKDRIAAWIRRGARPATSAF